MSSRKPCINVSYMTYSGKEQSPLHFGLSAEGFDLNFRKQGYDQLIWKVQMKNNKKVWVRTTEDDIEDEQSEKEQDKRQSSDIEIKPETSKTGVKKLTNYNLFLTYRLYELKKQYTEEKKNIVNKEIFALVVQEWKSLDKKSKEFEEIMKAAEEHNAKNVAK
jgi:hypothetical protein